MTGPKVAWENEYSERTFLTDAALPQKDVLRALKELTRKHGLALDGARVLDAGCGTGRNSLHCARSGASVSAFDIAENAVAIARKRAEEEGLHIAFAVHDMAEDLPYGDGAFDLVLDITSSNSLRSFERAHFLSECRRVLKPGGVLVMKALCLTGDRNARALVAASSVGEDGMYELPGTTIVEKAWEVDEVKSYYGALFEPVIFTLKDSYMRMNGRSYKRRFIVAAWRKPFDGGLPS
jgi:ubiquinone/menaquinone biosynthesis C-methylase UbiE